MKKFFNTPKKAIISTISISALVLAAGIIVPTVIIKSNLINKDEIKEIVLADASLSAKDIYAFRTELDFEDGHFQYDVDFYSNGVEYEYRLLAKNGDIISRDTDGKSNSETKKTDQSSVSQVSEQKALINTTEIYNNEISDKKEEKKTSTSENIVITEEEAKAITLMDAGIAENEATFIKFHLDRENSILVYDIEFYTAQAEYEYEISAVDGTIRERNTDIFDMNNSAAVTAEYIGADKVKENVANHAGLKLSEIQFTKVKLENDNGKTEYDIKFYHENAEYEYSVDAVSGEIIEYDLDYR